MVENTPTISIAAVHRPPLAGHKPRSASQSQRLLTKPHDSLQRKIKIKIDPEAETIVSCSTEEFSGPRIGTIKTTAYTPGKSHLSVLNSSSLLTSPAPSSGKIVHSASTSAKFKTPEHATTRRDPTEEIKIQLSEGSVPKPKPRPVDSPKTASQKYAAEKTTR